MLRIKKGKLCLIGRVGDGFTRGDKLILKGKNILDGKAVWERFKKKNSDLRLK